MLTAVAAVVLQFTYEFFSLSLSLFFLISKCMCCVYNTKFFFTDDDLLPLLNSLKISNRSDRKKIELVAICERRYFLDFRARRLWEEREREREGERNRDI
jgi:hypothetical protein